MRMELCVAHAVGGVCLVITALMLRKPRRKALFIGKSPSKQLELSVWFGDNASTQPLLSESLSASTQPLLSESLSASAMLYTWEGHQRTHVRELDDDGLAPLTRWVQIEIHQRMNPKNCSNAKFLISQGWPHGIGSTLHVIGTHLAYAIQNGLVLEWGSETCRNFIDQSECSSIGMGCSCLFQKITSCPNDVVQANSVGIIKDIGYQLVVPDVFVQALQNAVPNMREQEILFWWRAQSVGYLARFNNVTLSAVTAMRRQDTHYYKGPNHTVSEERVPLPLPHGTINAHIRHGDKVLEMALVPAEKYFEAAQRLAHQQPLSFGSRTYFVSSDNADAIETSRKLAESAKWGVAYSRIYRMKGGFASPHWGDITGLARLPTLYTQLLQLLMSLEADAWIGTRGSNGNRLIDELRCIWVDKCRHMYVEVGTLEELDYVW